MINKICGLGLVVSDCNPTTLRVTELGVAELRPKTYGMSKRLAQLIGRSNQSIDSCKITLYHAI